MSERPIVVISTYPPEHCGVGRDAQALVQSLRQRREVVVLANEVPSEQPARPEAQFAWRKNDLRYPFRLARRVAAVARERGTVVHVFHHFFLYGGPATVLEFPLLVLLLHLRGYRVVVQYQSIVDPAELEANGPEGLALPPGGATRFLLQRFYHAVDRWADQLVVCTRSMVDRLERVYGAPSQRVHLVPVGWRRPPSRSALEGKDSLGLAGCQVVLFHGFLDPSKGLDDLIDAFARSAAKEPSWRLVVAGEVSPHLPEGGRPFLERLRAQAQGLGLAERVLFTGYLDEERLALALASADIVVLPYTMRYSHGGSAVLSRVAGLGRPLIASSISRFADELEDGVTALLVSPHDPGAIAAAIDRLRGDAVLAERLGSTLKRHAEERTWDRSADLLLREVYAPLEHAGTAAA